MFRLIAPFPRIVLSKKLNSPIAPSRSILNVSDLRNTYQIFHRKKYLSPLYGGVGVMSNSIKRFYEAIQQSQGPCSATEKLIMALFNKIDDEFRPSQNKSTAAYSLSPTILSKVISVLSSDLGNNSVILSEIITEWRKYHRNIAGTKISNFKTSSLLNYIIESKKECMQQLYPDTYTESILLTFFYLKSATREDLKNYLLSLNTYENLLDIQKIHAINENQPHDYPQTFLDIINYDNKPYLQVLFEMPAIVEMHYEKIMLQALQPNYQQSHLKTNIEPVLIKVALGQYNYCHSKYVSNCVETSIHNFCNIVLYDLKTESFNFNLLPASLHPCADLKKIYEIEEYTPQTVNLFAAGQAFMNLLSGNKKFVYVKNKYELETTPRNFLPIINFLFGTQAATLEELSKLFSDENRNFTFKSNQNTITVELYFPQFKKMYKMSFHYSDIHCQFESDFFPKEYKCSLQDRHLHAMEILGIYANDKFHIDPMWLVLLNEKYNVPFAFILANENVELHILRNILFYLVPLKGSHSYHLIKDIFSIINNYPHWKTIFNYIIKNDANLIYEVAEGEDVAYLNKMIQYGGNVNSHADKKNGMTPLHAAKNIEIINLLISSGANPNAVDNEGRSPLHHAMQHRLDNKIDLLKRLLIAGANPNLADNNGKTPLYFAKEKEAVECLLTFGADVNIRDINGRTPIFMCTDIVFVKTLITANANLSIKDNDGLSIVEQIRKLYCQYRSHHFIEMEKIVVDAMKSNKNILLHKQNLFSTTEKDLNSLSSQKAIFKCSRR